MGLTTSGLNQLLGLGIGEALTSFTNASAFIGVGGGAGATGAFAISQTDLQGASKTRKACDSTYPNRSGNVLTSRATFTTSDANYVWDEFMLANASSGGVMLHRGVSAAFFTKNSSTTAVLTTTLTLTAA
jgi:hypothetical protein